jgi:hypothetical protein
MKRWAEPLVPCHKSGLDRPIKCPFRVKTHSCTRLPFHLAATFAASKHLQVHLMQPSRRRPRQNGLGADMQLALDVLQATGTGCHTTVIAKQPSISVLVYPQHCNRRGSIPVVHLSIRRHGTSWSSGRGRKVGHGYRGRRQSSISANLQGGCRAWHACHVHSENQPVARQQDARLLQKRNGEQVTTSHYGTQAMVPGPQSPVRRWSVSTECVEVLKRVMESSGGWRGWSE